VSAQWVRRSDDGAAAVEFALLFPIFMVLALGMINGGLAFSRQINVTQAAREASRFGATYDVTAAGGLSNWLADVDNAACLAAGNGNGCGVAAGSGNPIGGYDYRCVALVVRNSAGTVDPAKSGYKQNGAAAVLNDTTGCPSVTTPDFGPSTKFVQVVLSRDIKFFVLFISPTLKLDGISNSAYERTLAP
jgi:Flp pilus assembly protein TadG